MRFQKSAACFLMASIMASGLAFAGDEDDATWIAQCVADNKAAAAQVPAVVKKYCECMNEKMSENEMQSITAWEADHPKETDACVKKAVGG